MSGASLAPHLYLIASRASAAGRSVAAVVAAALRALPEDAALRRQAPRVAVQLREPDLLGGELFRLAGELREVTAAAGVEFFVNDRVDVALAVEADGVHLGWRSLSVEDVRATAPGLKIALSTHRSAEVEAVAHKAVSFVVFGPVFDNPSKRGLVPTQGLAGLQQACQTGTPVIALGGVTSAHVGECLNAGATGVGCIRAVMGAADPTVATAALLAGLVHAPSR